MNELISVIIPVYKAENCLDRCLNSVINQTYRNLEIILIDDGSPDNSGHICDLWAKKDNRIRAYHKKNGGQASARNFGLDKATGDYIGFVDDDDIIENEMYEILLKNAKKYGTLVSGCATMIVYPDKGNINRFKKCKSKICDNEKQILHILNQDKLSWGSVWNKIFHNDIKEKLYFPVGSELEDYWVILRIFNEINKIYFDNRPMYKWVQSESSQSSRPYYDNLLTAMNVSEDIFNYFDNQESNKRIIKSCYYFEFLILHTIINALCKSLEDKGKIRYYCLKALKITPKIIFAKSNIFVRYAKILKIVVIFIFADYLRNGHNGNE